eukprot:2296402-Rhodomonas_salina.1
MSKRQGWKRHRMMRLSVLHSVYAGRWKASYVETITHAPEPVAHPKASQHMCRNDPQLGGQQ